MAIFGKRPSAGGLGRGVGSLDDFPGDGHDAPPASEAIIDAEAASDTDPVLRADVDEAMREVSSSKPSWRQRLASRRGRAAQTGAADEDGETADAGDAGDVTVGEGVTPGKRKLFSGIGLKRRARRDDTQAVQLAKETAANDRRLSNMVMIDFYPGLTKEDAIETARHWAMTHMDVPSLCFYFVMKIRDGYAVEVQEGVGKAYLPSVIELATENPGRIIVVPMVRRKLTVFYSARMGEFEAQILPELQEPPLIPENPSMQASRSVSMTPVLKQHVEWLYAGAGTAIVGGLALLTSLVFYAVDPRSKVPPEWHTTDVSQLPVEQWGRLNANASDSYVVRMEYTDGQWRIVRQSVSGSTVDMAPAVGGATPPVDGSAAPDQGTPGAVPSPAPDQNAAPAPPGDAGGAPTNIPPPSDAGGR